MGSVPYAHAEGECLSLIRPGFALRLPAATALAVNETDGTLLEVRKSSTARVNHSIA